MQLAALELLSLTATYQGHGKMATKLLGQAIDMGKRMQLLSDRPTGSNLQAHTGPDVRAASYAAWGLFSYATYVAQRTVDPHPLTMRMPDCTPYTASSATWVLQPPHLHCRSL